jgi:predicted nucleic acid-binding protein
MDGFRGQVITTKWVLAELANALAAPVSRTKCAQYIRFLQADSDVEIVGDEEALFERGLRLYEQRRDKEWSLTDCISFVVMQRKRLKQALTGDHHFEQAGFIALLK